MSNSNKLSDEDPEVPIPHATVEMYWHCEKKGAQMGSLVTMALAPLVVAYRGGRGRELLMRTGRATAIGAFLVGPLLGMSMCFAKLHNAEPIAIYDRAYRLRFNKGQVRTDIFSGAVGLVGAGMGAALMRPPLTGGLYGAAFGIGLGTIVHVLTKHKETS